MTQKPRKEKVREWLIQRHTKREPLPDFEQIKRQLDWQSSDKDGLKMFVEIAELHATCSATKFTR